MFAFQQNIYRLSIDELQAVITIIDEPDYYYENDTVFMTAENSTFNPSDPIVSYSWENIADPTRNENLTITNPNSINASIENCQNNEKIEVQLTITTQSGEISVANRDVIIYIFVQAIYINYLIDCRVSGFNNTDPKKGILRKNIRFANLTIGNEYLYNSTLEDYPEEDRSGISIIRQPGSATTYFTATENTHDIYIDIDFQGKTNEGCKINIYVQHSGNYLAPGIYGASSTTSLSAYKVSFYDELEVCIN